MSARIAICIDDFGLHRAVDDAILALVARRRVSATSCMVGAPAWPADAPRLKEVFDAGLLDAGVHIDLTEYAIDSTLAAPVGRWMRDTMLRRVQRDRVQAEIRAQLDRFESAMQRAPSHVDGHQHVHQFPVIRDLLLHELVRRYPDRAGRPWLRSTEGAARWRLKGHVIEAMGARALARNCAHAGFAHNRSLLGVYDFRGGAARYEHLLRDWLRQARDGDLLMAHVAAGDVPGDEIAAARVMEYAVFSQEGFDALLRDAEVSVQPMSRILTN